jgi:hypothetical protein
MEAMVALTYAGLTAERGTTMKYMIMVFDEEARLRARPLEAIEQMVAFLVRLDDELAQSGELIYSEVLEHGDSAALVEQSGTVSRGTFNIADVPLSRYWVVKVAEESRAIEIAASMATVLDAPIEVRRCVEQSLRP